jgi:hypothetical protein
MWECSNEDNIGFHRIATMCIFPAESPVGQTEALPNYIL